MACFRGERRIDALLKQISSLYPESFPQNEQTIKTDLL